LETPEILLQCFGIDLKRRIFTGMPLDDFENFSAYLFCFIPMAFIPFLQDFDLTPNLNIQFDIICKSWIGKIAGPNKRHRTNNGETGVRNVSLSMKLFFGVYPAVYLPLFDCINNSGHPLQEVILLFFLFNAAIEYAFSSLDTCKEGLLGSLRNFIAHED